MKELSPLLHPFEMHVGDREGIAVSFLFLGVFLGFDSALLGK